LFARGVQAQRADLVEFEQFGIAVALSSGEVAFDKAGEDNGGSGASELSRTVSSG